MADIVDKILEMESSAEKRVLDANRSAAELRDAVEAEINAILAEARAQAQDSMQKQIAQARENAERSVKEAVALVRANNGRSVNQHEQVIKDAVERIVSLVIKPEYERG